MQFQSRKINSIWATHSLNKEIGPHGKAESCIYCLLDYLSHPQRNT